MKKIQLFSWHCVVEKHTSQNNGLQFLDPAGCVSDTTTTRRVDSLGNKYL